MKYIISIPATSDRICYNSKEHDTLWDMINMLENELGTSHPFISLFQDHFLSEKMSYAHYYSTLSSFSNTKWYVKVEPDYKKLFDKKYAIDNGEKIIYDFTDFEEIINSHLDDVLNKVSNNHTDRMVEFQLTASHPEINQIIRDVLPKLIYSYYETNEMGKTFKINSAYNVVKITIDQSDKKLSEHMTRYIKTIINNYDIDNERLAKGKKIMLLIND